MPPDDNQNQSKRLGALETSVASLVTTVENLANTITESIKESRTRDKEAWHAIDTLRINQSDSSKPNYKMVLGICGFMLVFTTAIGGLALAPLYLSGAYTQRNIIKLESHHNYMDDKMHGLTSDYRSLNEKEVALRRELDSIDTDNKKSLQDRARMQEQIRNIERIIFNE